MPSFFGLFLVFNSIISVLYTIQKEIKMNNSNTKNFTLAFATTAERELLTWRELLDKANQENAHEADTLAIERQIDRLQGAINSLPNTDGKPTNKGIPCLSDDAAYPVVSDHAGIHMGLTKREYLAALAMQALVANPQRVDETDGYLAECAVSQADAMIEALNL